MNARTLSQISLRALPFLALGGAALVGLYVATTQAPEPPPAPVVVVPTPTKTGPFSVVADFDRRLLPRAAGDVFLRVAVTGDDLPGKRMPAAVTLLIDRSGSMAGDKIADAKRAARRALLALKPGDAFEVFAFGSGVHALGAGLIDDDTLAQTLAAIDALDARGGTDMISALRAVEERAGEDRVRRVMLLSDGHPDTANGLVERTEWLAARGFITTTLGVGLDYNEDLMADLADHGRGNYHFVEKTTDLGAIFAREMKDLSQVVARDVIVELDAAAPAFGAAVPLGVRALPYEAGKGLRVAVGDVYAGRTVELLFRVPVARFDIDQAQLSVRAHAAEGVSSALARATFSDDAAAVARSHVESVVVQAAQWRTSQVWLSANAYFNADNVVDGNRALDEQLAQLEVQAQQLGSVELRNEVDQLRSFRADNNDGVTSRRKLNNYAKWKAREMNR